MNVGVIGIGFMGKIHLTKLAQLQKEGKVNVVAVADINKEKITSQILEECGVPDAESFIDYRELLKNYSGDLDAVTIATPTSLHYSIAKDALNNNINVLIEKPGCETKEQAVKLKEIAENKERNIYVGYQLRFKPPVVYTKKILEEEGLKVHSIRGSFGKYQPKSNTGAHRDLSSHGLDLINIFMKETPYSISGFFTRYHPPHADEPRESTSDSTLSEFELLNPFGTAVYVLRYGNPEKPNENAIATLDSSFDSPRRFGELYLRCTDQDNQDRVELYINFAETNYALPISGPENKQPDLIDGLFAQGVQYLRAPSHREIDYSDARLVLFPGMESEDNPSAKARNEMVEGITNIARKYGIKSDIKIIEGSYDSIYEENKAWIKTLEKKDTNSPLATIDDAILVHNIIKAGEKSNKYSQQVLV